MQDHWDYRHVIGRAVLVALLAAGAAACTDQSAPAPVYMKSGASTVPPTAALEHREIRRIVVESGRTLNGIAHDYRVPPAAIIAANRLQPPYELKAGQRLIIPDVEPAPMATGPAASHAAAALPPAGQPPKQVAATPLPSAPAAPNLALPPQTIFPQPASAPPAAGQPASVQPAAAPPTGLAPKPVAGAAPPAPNPALPPQTIVAQPDAAKPATPPQQQAVAPAPQQVASAKSQPEVIPLDGPAPPKQAASGTAAASPAPPKPAEIAAAAPAPLKPASPPPAATPGGAPAVLPPRNPAAALPLPGEEPAPVVTATSGRFAWPVYGRVLTGFGASTNGARNDGINIAAARGTPVHSVDSGSVAYVGNEVKGYGNLVLIKHENGFISAYAHLDDPTVKVGEKIRSGQVIGKVGETGGVKQPQLHFELRRGQKPVDPREFLPPTPSASGPAGNPPG